MIKKREKGVKGRLALFELERRAGSLTEDCEHCIEGGASRVKVGYQIEGITLPLTFLACLQVNELS